MASFNDIVKSAPKQSAFADGAVWTLRSMLEALQKNVLENHGYIEDDIVADMRAAFGERLDVHTVFDILHDSDECCSAEVLCIDGRPALLYKRIGDRSDYADGLGILDKDLARQLLAVLVDYHSRVAFARMEAEQPMASMEEQLWNGTQYLVPLTTGIFYVGSPKWACGFSHVFKSHRAYTVTTEGELIRVTGFVQWANKLPSWESKQDKHVATFETERGQMVLDARNVLFTLVDDKDELRAVAAELAKPCYWRVTRLETHDNIAGGFAHIVQHRQGRAFCGHASLHLNDKDKAQEFYARFGEPQPGVYSRTLPALAEYREFVETGLCMALSDD